jgi:Flp pilus assembly CpaF family ATPase
VNELLSAHRAAPRVADLVHELSSVVSERLADERVSRRAIGESDLTPEGEVEFARQTALAECVRLNALRGNEGKPSIHADLEREAVSRVVAQVLGLGRLQPLLEDDEVSDIHIRGAEPVWVKLRSGVRESRPPVVDSDQELVDLVRRIASRMTKSERRFDAGSPEVNLQLPDGSRLFAVMDVSKHPSVVIRRHRFEIASLEDLHLRGMMDADTRDFFRAAVLARRNMVIAGGTGSGKTTLLRALLNEVPRDERIVTIEDAYELGIERFSDQHPDHDALQSRPMNTEGTGEVTLADLTRMALRMDPDRVIVGEVRGAEAFPMLMAMSQGNNGSMCTMHADGTRSVFPKLAAYVSMASTGLPVETVNLLIASAVHFVVYIDNASGVRRITSIREVVDSDGVTIVSNEVFRLAAEGATGYPFRDSTRRLLSSFGYEDVVAGLGSR